MCVFNAIITIAAATTPPSKVTANPNFMADFSYGSPSLLRTVTQISIVNFS